MYIKRSGQVIAAAMLALVLTACGGAAPDDQAAPADVVDSGVAVQETVVPGIEGDGDDYAFDVERDQMATAITAAFSTQNGQARWDGDTLVLAVDGDATATMAGFTQCRVLLELLKDQDVSVIEFPNGQVACADVLP